MTVPSPELQDPRRLAELEQIIRSHARENAQADDVATLNTWLNHQTVSRYLEWIPAPLASESRLLEIGCYQPSVGYYMHLGWKDIVGCFVEEGECNREGAYRTEAGSARMVSVNAETETIPVPDGWAYIVLMMEVFEHFAVDPMHALWEANRVLKPGGRMVFSTPNAASFYNIHRIFRGYAPYAPQEFNGFTRNRHNRLYDVRELQTILSQAGFHVEATASRSYRNFVLSRRQRGFRAFLFLTDSLVRLTSGQWPERGDWLVIQAIKESTPRERYPRSLYFNSADWPSWIGPMRKKHASRLAAAS